MIPSLLPIFLADTLLVYIYAQAFAPESFYIHLFGYIILEAIFTLIVGYIGDHWNRRYILLIIHVIAFLILSYGWLYPHSFGLSIFISSILFSPNPVCRASIIDNYKSVILGAKTGNFYKFLSLKESQLISLTWLVQYSPWVLYPIFVKIIHSNSNFILSLLMGLSLLLTFFFFKDTEDKKPKHKNENLSASFNKIPYTFISLLLAQTVFFTSFDKLHTLSHQPLLFCLVGVGAFIGTLFAFFYKNRSHLSIISNAYLYGFILSITSFLYLIGTKESIPLELDIILLATIGGLYLPYVYDLIAEKSRATQRSTMFAVAETIQFIASILGTLINTMWLGQNLFLFATTSLIFLLSLLLQSKER